MGGRRIPLHPRTGMLGQGNRTALPICGYFLGSVLNDPAFKQYRSKFDAPHHDTDLYQTEYDCGGYFSAPADSDSIAVDSLDIDGIDEYIEYDEHGNPLPSYQETDDTETQPEPAETENAEATKEE